MTESALLEAWKTLAQAALEWKPGDDLESIFEALSMSSALELTSDLPLTRSETRTQLRRLGQRAMLHLAQYDEDEEALEAMRHCASLARDGLRALSERPLNERPLSSSPSTNDSLLAPPKQIMNLLEGRLDGFEAASLAIRIRRDARARLELERLLELRQNHGQETHRIALAAAESIQVLDPSQGRSLGTCPDIEVEAVLFETENEYQLALYAASSLSVRLDAEQLTFRGQREGYWLGTVQENTTKIRAILHAGDAQYPWELTLTDDA